MNTISAARFRFELKATRYDHVASMLIALLMLAGFFVGMMTLAWAMTLFSPEPDTLPEPSTSPFPLKSERPSGHTADLDEPNRNEMTELREPQLETTLAAVTDAISTQEAQPEVVRDGAESAGQDGDSDGRTKGPPGPPAGMTPRWERWQIQYNTKSLASYAKQLDHFEIELGAAGGGRAQVDYASRLSAKRLRKRKGPGDKEKRLYFSWKDGKLRAFDIQLLAKAGIPTTGRITLQFVPKKLEDQLSALERAYAKGKGLTEIKLTRFGIRGGGSKYEFYVDEMQFRAKAD